MTTTTTNRAGVMKLWLLNLVANAAVLAVAYFWLLIPDAHGWQVAGSALLAVAIIFSVLWLRAGTLAWFRVGEHRANRNIWPAYRRSLRHIPALAFWVLSFVVIAWWIWELRTYVPQFSVLVRQKLGAGPTPRSIMNDLNWLILLVVFLIMPALWLPIGSTVSAAGVHPEHLALSRRVWKRPLYWLWFAVLMAALVYVPYKLIWWIPDLQTLRRQAWSMGARFLLAYVIVVTAFIAVVWLTAVFTDREDPASL